MRRPISPSPRRSQDTRSNTPSPDTLLHRSSSDVSSRPNRLLAKLKNAGVSTSSNSASNVSVSIGGAVASQKAQPTHSRTSSNPALIPPASSSLSGSATGPRTNVTSPKSTREMHRLGNIPAQVALAPAVSNAASASSLSLTSTLTSNTINPSPATTDPWHMLHVNVLPLFNGEPLRMPIEELNQLVKKHISSVVSRSLSRAISTLEQDIAALLARGMITLNVKLSELDDKKLLPRMAEVWEFFWHGILPYVEGVFHPLKTHKLVQSLSRTPKTNRASSPTLPDEQHATVSTQSIDVRVLALCSFRDSILLPISSRLHALLTAPQKDKSPYVDGRQSYHPKLQQMLLVLVSAQHSHILAAPSTPASPGEGAVLHLLRAIRNPHGMIPTQPFGVTRLPSFFSGSAPRDRRGRIARKSSHYTVSSPRQPSEKWERESDDHDEETPRNTGFGDERDREKEFLESLRSPDRNAEEENGVDGPAGGWGLGRGQEHQGAEEEEEEEEEDPLDWEAAQDVVERILGLRL